ncbi:MAG TPA: hypothetical protein PLM07_17370 [Candidatus Rifleibacterium sp.]|nr:hypothetical protein [Candidatus Rifleibacterium sp.]HPT47652.1 hypothetical protein [Candidatus Rifleibacterium sp.]
MKNSLSKSLLMIFGGGLMAWASWQLLQTGEANRFVVSLSLVFFAVIALQGCYRLLDRRAKLRLDPRGFCLVDDYRGVIGWDEIVHVEITSEYNDLKIFLELKNGKFIDEKLFLLNWSAEKLQAHIIAAVENANPGALARFIKNEEAEEQREIEEEKRAKQRLVKPGAPETDNPDVAPEEPEKIANDGIFPLWFSDDPITNEFIWFTVLGSGMTGGLFIMANFDGSGPAKISIGMQVLIALAAGPVMAVAAYLHDRRDYNRRLNKLGRQHEKKMKTKAPPAPENLKQKKQNKKQKH